MATANNEFFEALAALEKERGLPEDYLIEKIKAAIVNSRALRKDYEVEDDNVSGRYRSRDRCLPRQPAARHRGGSGKPPHPGQPGDAQKVRKSYKVGQRMVTQLKTKEFGRIAAQTAKHVIRQGLREGERNLQCSEMQSRAHELITATVVSIDPERGNIVLGSGQGPAAPCCPATSRSPGRPSARVRPCRSTSSMCWRPTAAPV